MKNGRQDRIAETLTLRLMIINIYVHIKMLQLLIVELLKLEVIVSSHLID